MDEHTSHELAYKKGYEQGKQDAMKWIPVTERLPEEGQRVLSVKEEGYVEINCITNRTGDWFSRAYDPSSVITHWMPLPPAPEENK